MANTDRGRKPIKRGTGRRMVDGKNFRLADEVRHILRRAAEHDGRIVTIGQLILFSTETGDAWLSRMQQGKHRQMGLFSITSVGHLGEVPMSSWRLLGVSVIGIGEVSLASPSRFERLTH